MTEKVPIHFAFSHNLVSVRVSGNRRGLSLGKERLLGLPQQASLVLT